MNEQAGIYAGDEGYDINVNKHTDLKGALITSTQKAEEDGKNHFSTSSLTHSDIENHSNYSGSSFGVSGSVSANFETPFGENGAAQSTKQATDKDGNLLYTDKNGNTTVNSKGVDGQENTKKLAEGKESLQFSYGMGYGKDSDSQSSTTKSGINTQNIIIKDEAEQLKRTGKTVQEEIAAIKTDITTESAQSQSGKLENRFNKDDVQKELDFQREVTEKFGPNVAEAGSLLANKFGEEAKAKRHEAAIALEEAEKAKAENNNETNQALAKQARDNFETASREAKEWETGGSQRLVIDSALNVISTALAGRPAAEVVASGLSPAVNNQIKKATTDAKGNVNTALNLTAHALWGAVEAYAGNRNVAAGAAGAAGGEAAANFLASTLYDKSPEKLSEEEKRTVSSLSQVAAGIVGGSLSDSSDGAIIAAKTAKSAVENNYLKPSDLVEAERKYKACKGDSDCEMRVVEETNELSKKRNQELDEYRQSLERELLAAKRSAEQQCAGNSDCYLAYSQEANKHFKEQLNAYLAHVSEGKDFESLARNYYPDDAYFRSIWYGLTNSGPQKTKESLKSAKDYIDNTSFGEVLDDTLRIGEKLVRLPKEWIEQDIPAHSVEKALREMTDGNPQDVGEVFFGLTTGAATVSVAGKTMKWIGGKWVRSPDVDYSRDNTNLGVNRNKGLNERISNRQKDFYLNEQNLNREANELAKNIKLPISDKVLEKHIINGEPKGSFFKGGHTTLGNVKVEKVIKEYANGVYEAKVSIPNPRALKDPNAKPFLEKSGKEKDSVSTMFPRTWTQDRLKVELEHAFKNASKVPSTKSEWKGVTKSGVEVRWYVKENGKIDTIYPKAPSYN